MAVPIRRRVVMSPQDTATVLLINKVVMASILRPTVRSLGLIHTDRKPVLTVNQYPSSFRIAKVRLSIKYSSFQSLRRSLFVRRL